MPKLEGKATVEGTGRYAARFAATLAPGHFRETSLGLRASSIGLGTYLGEPDGQTDDAYFETASGALRSGINVLDSAINYRHQRSERSMGRALAEAAASGAVTRDEILVATKGGFIAFDGDVPESPADWFRKTFVDSGLVGPEDLVAQCHVMSPAYLEDQLERSLRNLGLAQNHQGPQKDLASEKTHRWWSAATPASIGGTTKTQAALVGLIQYTTDPPGLAWITGNMQRTAAIRTALQLNLVGHLLIDMK